MPNPCRKDEFYPNGPTFFAVGTRLQIIKTGTSSEIQQNSISLDSTCFGAGNPHPHIVAREQKLVRISIAIQTKD